jgi:two-component system response regulator
MAMHDVELLLVEDRVEDAELTIRALRQQHLAQKLHLVRDGAEALDFLFGTGAYAGRDVTRRPKVVLLDLKLPKVGGLEVLRRMRADARTRTIPVVVLTSSREEGDLVASYRLGVNSYVVKPVDFERFFAAVSQLGVYWTALNQVPC